MRLKELRNQLSHFGSAPIDDADFQIMWKKVLDILNGLQYNTNEVAKLRTCSLGGNHEFRVSMLISILVFFIDKLDNEEETRTIAIAKLQEDTRDNSNEVGQLKSKLAASVTDIYRIKSLLKNIDLADMEKKILEACKEMVGFELKTKQDLKRVWDVLDGHSTVLAKNTKTINEHGKSIEELKRQKSTAATLSERLGECLHSKIFALLRCNNSSVMRGKTRRLRIF